ncbi:ArsC family reductase [Marinicellulosiphila megalodicopiae]|uniref:ArsC family reductase n=1 Tax=Marinicellulosiphila megalodicopiae TaxID=2724896 RepID=UPI003BB1061D
MSLIMYGINNCDTIKKAKKYMEAQEVAFEFYDYKTNDVPVELLKQWIAQFGWEEILNKRGTTFRKLEKEDKENIDAQKALALLTEHSSMIKRPIFSNGEKTLVGFQYSAFNAFVESL